MGRVEQLKDPEALAKAITAAQPKVQVFKEELEAEAQKRKEEMLSRKQIVMHYLMLLTQKV